MANWYESKHRSGSDAAVLGDLYLRGDVSRRFTFRRHRRLGHMLPGGEHLHDGLEGADFAAAGDSIFAVAVSTEEDDAFGDEGLFAVGELCADEVEGVEAWVGEGFDLLATHAGFGFADLRDAGGFALAVEFDGAGVAFGERDFAFGARLRPAHG